jgi:hypothetical protein
MSNLNMDIYLKVSGVILILCLIGFPTLGLFGRNKTIITFAIILFLYFIIMTYAVSFGSGRLGEKKDDNTYLYISTNIHVLIALLAALYCGIAASNY